MPLAGSVYNKLWHDLNRVVYVPCFKDKILIKPVCDPITKKLISGPLIVKTDAGPGHLSKEAESIDLRDEMAKKGVHILLSLPNGTAATAEMDQLYSKFKPRCSDSTIRVAGIKMVKQATMRKKHAAAKATINFDAPIELGLEISDKSSESESEGDETFACKKKGKTSLCNVSMGNRDLANIVNGFPGDSVKNRRFTIPSQKKTS
jgi:hypothetical protein